MAMLPLPPTLPLPQDPAAGDAATFVEQSFRFLAAPPLWVVALILVPGTLAFEVALAEPGYECTYDVVLYSVFESAAALDAYQNHPQHVALKPFVAAVRSERQCMDYHVA